MVHESIVKLVKESAKPDFKKVGAPFATSGMLSPPAKHFDFTTTSQVYKEVAIAKHYDYWIADLTFLKLTECSLILAFECRKQE